MQKQPGANTIELTARLDRELDALQQELPRGMTIDRRIFRQADFIEVAVDNVVKALRDGGILVIIVVLLFLANMRAAAITLTAMPLSLAAAILVLRAFGATINTMTLGGMAIAIGALVDDAIIDVENVVRRLRENTREAAGGARPGRRGRARSDPGDPHLDRLRDDHHRAGVPADLRPVGRRRPAADAAGLRLHRRRCSRRWWSRSSSRRRSATRSCRTRRSIERGHDGWLARNAQGSLRARCCRRALDRPRLVIAAAVVLLAGAAFAITRMGTAFLPEFHEGSLTVQANTLPGTSLAKSDEIGRRVEQILLAQPEVVATARRTGRAELDEHVQGVEAAEIDVGLRETDRPREELLAALRRGFSTLPGTNVTIGQPISHRIDHMLSGTRANIAVKVFGDDLRTLRRLGERVRDADGRRAGRRRFVARAADGHPVRALRAQPVRRSPATGCTCDDVAEAVETSFAGATVGRIFDRGAVVRPGGQVRSGRQRGLRADRRPADRHAVERAGARSACWPTFAARRAPNMILRENVQRRIVISCNVAGRDLGSVVADIQSGVGQAVPMPAGYRVEYGGQFESQQSASRRLLILWLGVVAGLFMLLVLAFGRVARRGARHGQSAAGADRRRGRRVPGRRRAERRVDDRLHHAVRHRDAQRDHAGVAHPAPDERGRASPISAKRSSAARTSGWCRS